MIVRNVNDIIYIITDAGDDTRFMEKNPGNGFMQVDNLPDARYGNYKWEANAIVVDTVKEAAALALQYRDDRNYPTIEEQLDMQYHDAVNSTTTWVDAIAAIKVATPKP